MAISASACGDEPPYGLLAVNFETLCITVIWRGALGMRDSLQLDELRLDTEPRRTTPIADRPGADAAAPGYGAPGGR